MASRSADQVDRLAGSGHAMASFYRAPQGVVPRPGQPDRPTRMGSVAPWDGQKACPYRLGMARQGQA